MEQCGFEMVRYADDMVVLCRSHEEAQAALTMLKEWMEGAGLTLHLDKTRAVDMNRADSHFDFLGYRFQRSRRGRLMRLVRPKNPVSTSIPVPSGFVISGVRQIPWTAAADFHSSSHPGFYVHLRLTQIHKS